MQHQLKSLNHVALQVSNVEKSIDFYANVLGLKPLENRPNFDFKGAWFSLGENTALHLLEGLDYEVKSFSRGTHFAVEVKSIIDTEILLKSKNIAMKGPKTRPDGAWQIFITDPDGHCIEFTELV